MFTKEAVNAKEAVWILPNNVWAVVAKFAFTAFDAQDAVPIKEVALRVLEKLCCLKFVSPCILEVTFASFHYTLVREDVAAIPILKKLAKVPSGALRVTLFKILVPLKEPE